MFGLFNYLRYRKLKVDEEILLYRHDLMKGVENLAIQCAKDTAEYEHEFHFKMESLRNEIALIEANRDSMLKDEAHLKEVIQLKDAEIERLTNLCNTLANGRNYNCEELSCTCRKG